jgi:hypothetical protein
MTPSTPKGSISLKDALENGTISMKNVQRLHLTEGEAAHIIKVSTGTSPYWTPQKVKEDVGFAPDGMGNSFNLFTHTGRLRAKYPGKSDDEICAIESAKRNAARARLLLYESLGSPIDKKRFTILSALNDLAGVATMPLMIPSASGVPWVGSRLAPSIGPSKFSPLNPIGPMKGPVVAKFLPNATPADKAEVHAYVAMVNRIWRTQGLSPSGRVSTVGALGKAASAASTSERAAAVKRGVPYAGVVGHAPDATWSGRADSPFWLDLTRRVNSSLGGQVKRYPIGFRPTGFTVE